jgi:hypothetical protein
MKIRIDKNQKDAFRKACLETRFTCQFHEDAHNDLILIAYVRDDQLGELTPALAFHLGVNFRCVLQEEINRDTEIMKAAWIPTKSQI